MTFCPNELPSNRKIATFYIIPKHQIISGAVVPVAYYSNIDMDFPVAVDNDDLDSTVGYFISTPKYPTSFNNSMLQLVKVENPGSTPTISSTVISVNVPFYNLPPDPPNKGLSKYLENTHILTGGARIRDGLVYTAHAAAFAHPNSTNFDRSGLTWYQINLASTPTVSQSGTFFDPSYESGNPNFPFYDFWNPSIGVSGKHDALVSMTQVNRHSSDSFAYTNIGLIGGTRLNRPNGTPIGTSQSIRYSFNTTPYQTEDPYEQQQFVSTWRWGDYAYTDVDPCDDLTFWSAQEYGSPSGSGWEILVLVNPSTPPAFGNLSGIVIQPKVNDFSVELPGTGFYDSRSPSKCRVPMRVQITSSTIGGWITPAGVEIASPGGENPRVFFNTCGVLSGGTIDIKVYNSDNSFATGTLNVANPTGSELGCLTDKLGVYRPSTSMFFLRDSHYPNPISCAQTLVNPSATLPVVGDWIRRQNAGNITWDTMGVYDTSAGVFYLCTQNQIGAMPTIPPFTFGNPGDAPLAGIWDSSMITDGVGVFRPSNGIIYLKRDLSTGFSDYYGILGNPGDQGIVGDWDGNALESIGVFRPANQTFYLTNDLPNGITYANETIVYGAAQDRALSGQWIDSNFTSIGTFRNGSFNLRFSLTSGNPDQVVYFGDGGDIPVVGNWYYLNGTIPVHQSKQQGQIFYDLIVYPVQEGRPSAPVNRDNQGTD
jgi:hypothetical protein